MPLIIFPFYVNIGILASIDWWSFWAWTRLFIVLWSILVWNSSSCRFKHMVRMRWLMKRIAFSSFPTDQGVKFVNFPSFFSWKEQVKKRKIFGWKYISRQLINFVHYHSQPTYNSEHLLYRLVWRRSWSLRTPHCPSFVINFPGEGRGGTLMRARAVLQFCGFREIG